MSQKVISGLPVSGLPVSYPKITLRERCVLLAVARALYVNPSPYGVHFLQIRDAYAWMTESEPVGIDQIHQAPTAAVMGGRKRRQFDEIIRWRLRRYLDNLSKDGLLGWSRVAWMSRKRGVEGAVPVLVDRKPRRHWRVSLAGVEALRLSCASAVRTMMASPILATYGELAAGEVLRSGRVVTPEEAAESREWVAAEYARRQAPAAVSAEQRAAMARFEAERLTAADRRGRAYKQRLEEAKIARARRRLERTIARLPAREAAAYRAGLEAAQRAAAGLPDPEGSD